MSCITSQKDGVKAALEIQQHIDTFNASREDIHEEPLSKGNDIIVSSSSCMERAQVVDFLASQKVTTHVFDAVLRGNEDKQTVYQIKINY